MTNLKLRASAGTKAQKIRHPLSDGPRSLSYYPSDECIVKSFTNMFGGKGPRAAMEGIRDHFSEIPLDSLDDISLDAVTDQDRVEGSSRRSISFARGDAKFLEDLQKAAGFSSRAETFRAFIRWAQLNLNTLVDSGVFGDQATSARHVTAAIVDAHYAESAGSSPDAVPEFVFRIIKQGWVQPPHIPTLFLLVTQACYAAKHDPTTSNLSAAPVPHSIDNTNKIRVRNTHE